MAGRLSVRGGGIAVESLPPERNWAQRLADVARGFHPVPDRLLTADEVAAMLSVPVSWVRESTRSGAIPVVELGR